MMHCRSAIRIRPYDFTIPAEVGTTATCYQVSVPSCTGWDEDLGYDKSLDSPFWQTFKGVKLLSNRSVHGFSIQIGMHCHTSVLFISLDLLFG